MQKFQDRAHAICNTHVPFCARMHIFRTRVIPTMGYVCQLAALPERFDTFERRMCCRILSIPFNAMPQWTLVNIENWVNVRIFPVVVLSIAAKIRTAAKTLDGWMATWTSYNADSVASSLPELTFRVFSPSYWNYSAYVHNLYDAHQGLCDSISFGNRLDVVNRYRCGLRDNPGLTRQNMICKDFFQPSVVVSRAVDASCCLLLSAAGLPPPPPGRLPGPHCGGISFISACFCKIVHLQYRQCLFLEFFFASSESSVPFSRFFFALTEPSPTFWLQPLTMASLEP